MSSEIQKNKNLFNKIIKELKRSTKVLNESYSKTLKSQLYGYSFNISLGMEFGDFEIVEVGSKYYLCVKITPTYNNINTTSLMANALTFLSNQSGWYNHDRNDFTIALHNDGLTFKDENPINGKMADKDIIKTKAYKNLEELMNEVASSKFEFELIREIYRGFPRRDLMPLMVYYSNTSEMSYVYEYKWSSNPENMCARDRISLRGLAEDSNTLKNVCNRTARYSEYSKWFDLVLPENLKSKVTVQKRW